MEIRDRRHVEIVQLRYPSFHAAARWTYTEGNRTLARVPWVDQTPPLPLSGKP
jgi:hypothetical protein